MPATAHPDLVVTEIGPYLFVITRGENYVQYECELADEPTTFCMLICSNNKGSYYSHRIEGKRQAGSTPTPWLASAQLA